MLSKVINDLVELRGANVKVFGDDTILDDAPGDEDLVIDTVELLREIDNNSSVEVIENFEVGVCFNCFEREDEITNEEGEEILPNNEAFYKLSDINNFLNDNKMSLEDFNSEYVEKGDINEVFEDEYGTEYVDISLPEFAELELKETSDYVEHLDNQFGMKELHIDNTFNYSVPINHHIDTNLYEGGDENYYLTLRCNRYGDVRGNYTDEVLLKSSELFALEEALCYTKDISFEMEIENEDSEEENEIVEVVCTINSTSERMEINIDSLSINDETSVRDSIDEVKEYIKKNLI